jgi:hypothetical protein
MMLGSWMDGCVIGPGSNLERNWGTDKPNPAAEIAGSDRRGKDIMIPGGVWQWQWQDEWRCDKERKCRRRSRSAVGKQ